MTVQYGYCTNVHAGADLEETKANLQRYAFAVKQTVSPQAPMGIGLWLSAAAARSLLAENKEDRIPEIRDWLGLAGLVPFTLNGFPFGNFHQKIVKHDVYLPTWWDPARSAYTDDLITILHDVLPPGMEGSISTLPISWGNPLPSEVELAGAAAALRGLAERLAQLEKNTGRLITLCLEPEPGCVLQRSSDAVWFFESYLFGDDDEADIRRHIRVCHDICHAAVMFEDQVEVLKRYQAAGIQVGKIQVSSAVRMDLANIASKDRPAAVKQLSEFDEPRYLHQTMVQAAPKDPPKFFEDLPQALNAYRGNEAGDWRVHFHVPIYLQRFGRLEAMESAILECLRYSQAQSLTHHYEVETYAWGVLPSELQQPDLASGIAEELEWFRQVMAETKP
jgi:hypothetical protein